MFVGRPVGSPKKIKEWRSTLTGTSRRGRKSQNDREVIEGILYILRTGCPWRDLPSWFGPWETVYSRFNRWSKTTLWAHLLNAFAQLWADEEWVMVDATIMRVHQDGSGPKGGQEAQAMGHSKGGLTTKIHAACDALGYPLGFIITCGQRHDSTQAKALLQAYLKPGSSAILDAGYDSNEIREFVKDNHSQAVIAYRKNRVELPEFDKHLYKERHKIENLFQKIKRNRRIATRYEKLHRTFNSMVTIASILVWIGV